jgi:hypothetical protein
VTWVGTGWLSVIGFCIWEKLWLDRHRPYLEPHVYEFRRWEMWAVFTLLGWLAPVFAVLVAREMRRLEADNNTPARLRRREK